MVLLCGHWNTLGVGAEFGQEEAMTGIILMQYFGQILEINRQVLDAHLNQREIFLQPL